MTTAKKYEIDYYQDLKQSGIPEVQVTAILRVLEDREERINQERLTKSDIKELEWKIEGLKKDTALEVEKIRNELIKWIISVGVGGVLAIAGLLKIIH